MIVLHLAAPAAFGGLERVLSLLAAGQRMRGHEVHVALVLDEAEGGPGHPLLGELAAAGVGVHPILVPSRRYDRERAAVDALLDRLRPDVFHTHGYRADVLHGGAGRRMGIAAVTTAHGFTGGGWRDRVYEALQRRAFRHFGAVVAVSRPLAAVLARDGVPAGRIHVVPNAADPSPALLSREAARRALEAVPGERVLGWVGRLSHEKGPDLLVEALARLGEPGGRAVVVGDGPERPRLERRARELGLAERIRWHGAVPEAGRLFPAFDLFVISSRTEGTPMALFEAMAAGVPVVATRVGGIPDVVGPEEAVLVPPGDPAALAAAVRSVLLDPRGAAARAAAARRCLLRDFSLDPWLARYERVYEACLPLPTVSAR